MRLARPTHASLSSIPGTWRVLVAATLLAVVVVDPVAASTRGARVAAIPDATGTQRPVHGTQPAADTPDDPAVVKLKQSAMGYDSATNRAQVTIKVVPSGLVAPWTWSVSVRGSVVASGTSTATSVSTVVGNDCRITSMSVTTEVADTLGHSAAAADTLDTSLCPPAPWHDYGRDRILAAATLSEASFVDRLRATGSPALPAAGRIYRKLVREGVNPAFALGMFQAESSSGTRGYAVITKNWGNILYYSWTREYGAVPYAPGNGYTYAMFPTWRASVRALCDLFGRYWDAGYRSIYASSAHWLGARPGGDRHLQYLGNIADAMTILPDDTRPVISDLKLPARSRSTVAITWTATDNRGVTDYQVKWRRLHHTWMPRLTLTEPATVLALRPGTWRIAVRARDAAGNWSAWARDTVIVR